MPALTPEEIRQALESLPDWTLEDDAIVRVIRFPEFMDGIRFVDRVAELAEAADHHPDIDIRYRSVRLALTSHDVGTVTDRDIGMAKRIDQSLR